MKITENRNLQILQILYSSIFCTFENENYKKSYSTSFVDLKEFNLEKIRLYDLEICTTANFREKKR